MEIEASHNLLGYRAIWHILRRDYGVKVKRYVYLVKLPIWIIHRRTVAIFGIRDTVMRIMAQINPEGAQQRLQRRLKRRTYSCKVHMIKCILF